MNDVAVRREAVAGIREYVARVREALGDLPLEEVDDLIGGLEADLTERARELSIEGDPVVAFGDPTAYAEELRAAAGLAPAELLVAPRQGPVWRIESWLRESGRRRLARWPWLADAVPVWWAMRGAVLGGFVAITILRSYPFAARFVVVLTGVALSFWWGRRGERAIGSSGNRVLLATNLLALLFLLPVTSEMTRERVVHDSGFVSGAVPGGGVWVDGRQASNLYAYDAQGNRIDRVRLFDQHGQALVVDSESWTELGPDRQPPVTAEGEFDVDSNIFPIRWGSLTGWESSADGWEPPVRISELAPAPPAALTPEPGAARDGSPGDAVPQDGSSGDAVPQVQTSPTPSGSSSPAPASGATSEVAPTVEPGPLPAPDASSAR